MSSALLAAGIVSLSCAGERGSIGFVNSGFVSGGGSWSRANPIVETKISVMYCQPNLLNPRAIQCTEAANRSYTDSIPEQNDECPQSSSDILCAHKLLGAQVGSRDGEVTTASLRQKASEVLSSVLSETAARDCVNPDTLATVQSVVAEYSIVKRAGGGSYLSSGDKTLDEKRQTYSPQDFCAGFSKKQ